MADVIISYDGPFVRRRVALENGLPHFFTGRVCQNGHIALRYASSGTCSACRPHVRRGKPPRTRWSYEANPKHCKRCGKQLTYKQRNYDCCSRLCANSVAYDGIAIEDRKCLRCGSPFRGKW